MITNRMNLLGILDQAGMVYTATLRKSSNINSKQLKTYDLYRGQLVFRTLYLHLIMMKTAFLVMNSLKMIKSSLSWILLN